MEDIKRKLAIIYEQLAERHLHKHIAGTCPLLFVALGLIFGILLQNQFNLSVFIWFLLLMFISILSVICFILNKFPKNNKYICAYLALACFICLGAMRHSDYTEPKLNDIRNYFDNEPVLATIRGHIATEPYISKHTDWKFAQFKPTDPTCSFYMSTKEIEMIHHTIIQKV